MKLKERLKNLPKWSIKGRVTSVSGPIIEAYLPNVSIGDSCFLENGLETEVVGFKEGKTLLMAFDDTYGVKVGSYVEASLEPVSIGVGEDLLGSVIDPFGNPLNKPFIRYSKRYFIKSESYNPLLRERIVEPLDVGVRSINALLTIGKGQRVGIMASAGVGKSTLLGMIARYTQADVNVVALIGERGREVREFIEDNLTAETLQKSVVVSATSDQTPLAKIRAVFTALAIANYFADQKRDVLFLVDSLTRLAMAQREIGLAVGEPPTSKGYTPSVFSLLPKIIEQAGSFSERGSITGIYTVLVEGDEIATDPVADAAVGFLDGHIVLSKEYAQKRIFPAIDPLKSISRLTPQLVDQEILDLQSKFIQLLAIYKDAEDMINMGLYKKGSSQKVDRAIEFYPKMQEFLRQKEDEAVSLVESFTQLRELVAAMQM